MSAALEGSHLEVQYFLAASGTILSKAYMQHALLLLFSINGQLPTIITTSATTFSLLRALLLSLYYQHCDCRCDNLTVGTIDVCQTAVVNAFVSTNKSLCTLCTASRSPARTENVQQTLSSGARPASKAKLY
eukprot:19793-Heterococcus_DN1.PRE.2